MTAKKTRSTSWTPEQDAAIINAARENPTMSNGSIGRMMSARVGRSGAAIEYRIIRELSHQVKEARMAGVAE